MARAKRTQRAEARRRYRAASAPAEAIDLDEGAAPSTGASRSSTPAQAKAPAPGERLSFRQAFGAAYHPVHVRPDIAALPWIATHTHALWVPLAITLASTVAVVATTGGDISLFMFAYFIQTPALGGVFIAGFLAPRASWLLGAIVGLFAAVCYSILVLFFPASIYSTLLPTEAQAREVVLVALLTSPPFGAFLASGAAWYRRFLRLSSPNRNRSRAQSQKKTQKPGDGRTRTSGTSQKAPAKR